MNQENPDSKKLQVTPVNEWKKKAKNRLGELLKLPSGLVVKVGKPYISDLIESGFVPGDLINKAMGLDDKKDAPAELKRQTMRLMSYVVAASLLQPKCVVDREPNYDKGEIHIKDLSDADRMAIYDFSQSEVRKLNSFRNEPDGGTDKPDSKNLQPASELNTGNK